LRNTICPLLELPGEIIAGATDEEVKKCHNVEMASVGYIFKRIWKGQYTMGENFGQINAFVKEVTA
jgi:hypothetical protein